jgi:hypothetical protein
MPQYKVAHIREKDQDIIIIPLERGFGSLSPTEQNKIIADLQAHASGARLRGRVVPVWEGIGGRMMSISPTPWHPYFKSLDLATVFQMLNKELSW